MPSLRAATLMSLAFVLAAAPVVAEGQIGGLIKKKVGDAVKGGDKAAPKTDDANGGSKMPRPVTASVFSAFQKGITVERAQRRETVKFLATIKTKEQYQSCTQGVAMSPEAQKILSELTNLKENATPEESQKAMSKMSTDLAKLSVDKCGEDPNKYSGQWRQDQVAKAEAAGIREFSAGLGTKPGPALSANSDDDDWFYRLLKEWIPPFCLLSKALQQEAAAKGVKVPGAGTNFNYVYSSTEASLLIPLCDILMPILRDLQ